MLFEYKTGKSLHLPWLTTISSRFDWRVGQTCLFLPPPQRSRPRPGKRNVTHAGIVGGYHVAITVASHLKFVKVVPAVMDEELLVRCDVPVRPEYDGPPVAVHADGYAHVWVTVVVDEPRPVAIFPCSW